ncbi:MAG TPA: DUF5985 family protein [Candidatus Eisenbacteria bacterium]|nr:DUF5985 family protein [Candidatus Eisenbacteria bacterium]
MNNFISGAIAMSSLVAGLFFLRFWKSSRDRFFLFFAVAFWIEAVNRGLIIHASASAADPEKIPVLYLIRLAAFSLILFAIFEKNRTRRR